MPGRVWYCTLVGGCIIPPHYAKKLLWMLDAIPPLPSNLPHTGVLEATMCELLSTPTMSTLASSASSVRASR